jgi:polyphosphate kinase 2
MSYGRHVRTRTSLATNPPRPDDFQERMQMDAKQHRNFPSQEQLHEEMIEVLDEELELELDDTRLAELLKNVTGVDVPETLDRHSYFKELLRLQKELVKLQDWVAHQKLKMVVLFEGRDAAGKGGVIKRVTQRLNPRICKVVALPAPSERERTQWYFQRYINHLPGAGEIVLFDRSWYNRAGVERVMGFCTEEECEEFFRTVPEFERMLVRSGIILVKYWFSITDEEQNMRFLMRIHDPLNSGSSARWIWNRAAAGSATPRPRKTCWSARIFRRRAGGWSRPWTKSGRGSTAFIICCSRCRMRTFVTSRSPCRNASTSRIIPGTRFPRKCTCRRFID